LPNSFDLLARLLVLALESGTTSLDDNTRQLHENAKMKIQWKQKQKQKPPKISSTSQRTRPTTVVDKNRMNASCMDPTMPDRDICWPKMAARNINELAG
jgi:hypothetical protein